ncbi:Peroxisomal acyl-coenzyme A oxidase 1 [Coemansia erecta]|nr:Peroxisomal acyl-coenzyme A oxidase 1 [Coemansia erecta]
MLNKLASLLFLHTLVQYSSDLFRLPGKAAFTAAQVTQLETALALLIEDVREQAVPLVDAFGLSDLHLNSALARNDGNVYENYLQWAMEDPLNRDDSGTAIRKEWFNKYYKPLLHGADARKQPKL